MSRTVRSRTLKSRAPSTCRTFGPKKRFETSGRPLELGARVQVVGANPQVFTARVGLDALLFQRLGKHLRGWMAQGDESTMALAGAFHRENRGEKSLLCQVVFPDALDAELERELETGECLKRRQHGRRRLQPRIAARGEL